MNASVLLRLSPVLPMHTHRHASAPRRQHALPHNSNCATLSTTHCSITPRLVPAIPVHHYYATTSQHNELCGHIKGRPQMWLGHMRPTSSCQRCRWCIHPTDPSSLRFMSSFTSAANSSGSSLNTYSNSSTTHMVNMPVSSVVATSHVLHFGMQHCHAVLASCSFDCRPQASLTAYSSRHIAIRQQHHTNNTKQQTQADCDTL
jgi:hypothetical protein